MHISSSLFFQHRLPSSWVSQLVVLLVVSTCLISSTVRSQQATTTTGGWCTVCKGGEPVTLPTKAFDLQGVPVEDCGDLEVTASALPAGSVYCQSIQSIGSICGCPVPESSCSLCHDGSQSSQPDKQLPGYPASDYIGIAPPGTLMTCDLLEAWIHSSIPSDTAQCLDMQLMGGKDCGCPVLPHPKNHTGENRIPDTTDSPPGNGTSNDKGDDEVSPTTSCSLCIHGESITLPDKKLELGDFPIENCGDLASLANLVPADSFECNGMRTLGMLCGCPSSSSTEERACSLCPNGERVPKPSAKIDWFSSLSGTADIGAFSTITNAMTCEILEAILASAVDISVGNQDAEFICQGAQLKSSVCGCSPGWKAILLAWIYRGSSAIVIHILRRPNKRRSTANQLLFGISVFDGIGSMAYVLLGLFAPTSSGFYHSVGSKTTCAVSAFMIQLGYTSMFYNMLLSIYYWLVINFGWTDRRLKMRFGMHASVVLVGLGLAMGATQYSGPHLGFCYVDPPPIARNWWPVRIFFTIPMSIVLVVITLCTISICYRVRQQFLSSVRWSARRNISTTTQRRVFWQAFFYVIAFYVTLPFQLWAYNTQSQKYWVIVLVAAMAPAQGFMNCLVYIYKVQQSNHSHRSNNNNNNVLELPSRAVSGSSSSESGTCSCWWWWWWWWFGGSDISPTQPSSASLQSSIVSAPLRTSTSSLPRGLEDRTERINRGGGESAKESSSSVVDDGGTTTKKWSHLLVDTVDPPPPERAAKTRPEEDEPSEDVPQGP